jgi:phosphate transport system protein
MLKTYEEKLNNIKDEISQLGQEVVDALELSLKALKNKDIASLKDIDLSSKKLNIKSNEIDNIIVTTLALYSPEAKDLRQLVSYLKISNELVRAGSNVRDFIKMFRKAYSDDLNTSTILEYAIPLQSSALLSLQTTLSMIDETSVKHIEEKYHRVIVEESKTDDLYSMIEKNILKLISKNLDLSKEYFDILSALRRLEKTADRAVSIANLLQFAQVGGEMVQS